MQSHMRDMLVASGQEHLVEAFDALDDAEEALRFIQQIEGLDEIGNLKMVLRKSVCALNEGADHDDVQSVSYHNLLDEETFLAEGTYGRDYHFASGLYCLSQGQAAVIILAGGSGSRLGISIPKGLFRCARLKQGKSLFHMHCDCIRSAENLAKAKYALAGHFTVPLFIMTSHQTHDETSAYFEKNNFFGLRREQVYFFKQGSLPCFDESSEKILMSSRSELCMAPAGNGAIYRALDAPLCRFEDEAESPLQIMTRLGVKHVQIVNVDNILADVADPYFLGLSIYTDSEIVVKTAPKESLLERVGVFARINGKLGVIEYSELGPTRVNERDPDTGELRYNHANLSCQVCTLRFLVKAAESAKCNIRYHAARKMVRTVSGLVPAIKIESFIFDMFHLSSVSNPYRDETNGEPYTLLVVDKDVNFAPIKNDRSCQADTENTAAALYLSRSSMWVTRMLQEMQGRAPTPLRANALDRLASGDAVVEVSPLVSFSGEALDAREAYIVSSLQNEEVKHICILADGQEADEADVSGDVSLTASPSLHV